MKKSLVAALTGALVVGATATTFAAANPFSDVPAGHWAYQAVTRLASEGIIEGYGDNTFRGNRNITRYEMAQMVAKALARYPQESSNTSTGNANTNTNTNQNAAVNPGSNTNTNISTRPTISGASRADLDRLAAEFRDELNELGVRVADLERNADMVKWTGKIEYTYGDLRTKDKETGVKSSSGAGHNAVFRLEPRAELNDHWSANARFDANVNFGNDTTQDVFLKRIFAEGDYDKFAIKLGRIGFCPAVEDGIVFDTVISGAELTFGSKWKAIVTAGRIGGGDEPEYSAYGTGFSHDHKSFTDSKGNRLISDDANNKTDAIGLNIQYNPGDIGLYGGVSYYYAKDDDFKKAIYSEESAKGVAARKNGYIDASNYYRGKAENKAAIVAGSLGYKISDILNIHGAYAKNTKADYEDTAWDALAYFGNYADAGEKGQWALWGGYSKFGTNVGIGSNQGDDVQQGTKGWHVGGAYAPFKNVGALVRYSDGKYITGGDKYRKVFGRLEFFF